MKGIFTLLILAVIASLFYMCDMNNEELRTVYEPQDSELALLMREIHIQAKDIRPLIEKNEELPEYDNSIDFIVEATPTKENVKGPKFEAMAKYYLQKTDSLYIHPDKESYNEMVESCIVCHQSFCPGPVKTIKKLIIK